MTASTRTNGKVGTTLGGALSNDAELLLLATAPYVATVTVEGTSPILFHRWSCESIAAKAGAAKNSATKKTDDVESYVYRCDDGSVGIPGMYLDHLCRVTLCVRPDHLQAVTHKVNVWRGGSIQALNAHKTHCDHGHEFTPENTYSQPRGGRACRACMRQRSREAAERRAERRTPAELVPRPHGLDSTYQWGCRCDDCRRASTERRRYYRLRSKGAA